MDTTTATTKPANGPETPISTRASRFGIGDRILINAPIVPMIKSGGGTGMKYGKVARTPHRRAVK